MNATRKTTAVLSASAFVMALSACGAAGQSAEPAQSAAAVSAENWSIDAEYTAEDGTITEAVYEPIDKASVVGDWKVCALFPHVKDALWVSANYGNVVEAERLGIQYNMFEAGGYGNLSTQVDQTNDCIVQGYDALIIGAISAEGNCSSIQRALDQDIVVVDFINGTSCGESVTSDPLYTQVMVSYKEAAELIGNYMVDQAGGESRKVAVFPGPDGAAFANDAVDGFTEAIKGSSLKTEVIRRGDNGLDIQLQLIEDALRAYPDATDVFGVDIAAEAGAIALRNAGKSGELGVYGYTLIPNLHQAIVDGEATAAVTDWTPYQGRMAVSQAARALEGQELGGARVGPKPEVISSENVEDVVFEDMFGPDSFNPVYESKPNS
ncbi:TMAO reductase system periplasmic protein TorT [Arthrobacter sp. NPDC089319]|uniref:TMAO reductase system periplasmic protein TorT n=1 Tax=Arthrobacter sp. NPDC089319 TaxID=3155915 RepID=UPI00344AE962